MDFEAGISNEWIKRSVSQVLANPWGEQQSLDSSYNEDQTSMAYYIEKDDFSDSLNMGDYTNLLGRYQPYDYFVANAFCDANYATFLQSLGITINPLHSQNLQALIAKNMVNKQQCSALVAFYEKL
ncbi:TPA: hypothetical protein ACKP1B_005315 [Serratia fonticola]